MERIIKRREGDERGEISAVGEQELSEELLEVGREGPSCSNGALELVPPSLTGQEKSLDCQLCQATLTEDEVCSKQTVPG